MKILNILTLIPKVIINRLFIILYCLDQFFSGLIFLKPDHTVSGEVGYAAYQGKSWGLFFEAIIDTIFFWQYKHCYHSIEWDEINKPQFKIWK